MQTPPLSTNRPQDILTQLLNGYPTQDTQATFKYGLVLWGLGLLHLTFPILKYRGSIPLFWAQDTTQTHVKPPIESLSFLLI